MKTSKVFESEHLKKQVDLLTFTPSVSEWVNKTNAIIPKFIYLILHNRTLKNIKSKRIIDATENNKNS